MANYVATAFAKAQAKLLNQFKSTELREIDPATYKEFRKSSEIMFPSHKALRGREDRVIEAAYIKRTKRSLGTARSSAPSYATGVSDFLTPSFATSADGFSLSLKQAGNNVFTYEEMMMSNIENVMKNFSSGNESNTTDFLFNNRSAKNIGVADGAFNTTNFVFEIDDSTKGNRCILITTTNMKENLYGGMPLTIFCDSIAYNKFGMLSNQGNSNSLNTSFQFGNTTYVHSLDLTIKAVALGYNKGFWVAAANGTFGILDWIPTQNRTGVDKAIAKWSMMYNPIDGCDYAVYNTGVAQDSTSTGGYTQDWLDNFEFTIDLAPELAPTDLAGSGETVLQAFALI